VRYSRRCADGLRGALDERSVPLSYWLRDQRALPAHLPVDVTVVEPETEVVKQVAPPEGGIDVLHIAAPLRQRDGMPYLELSPVGHARRLASKARGSDLFPVRLARWLAGFEPGRAPLIVLDPPCPGSEVDIRRSRGWTRITPPRPLVMHVARIRGL
jgi:cellulose synthase operon protein C